MQDGEVARRSPRAAGPQCGESLRDGTAHEDQGDPVRGKTGGVGPAAVQGRTDARNERGVIGEPAVHIMYAPDSKALAGQGRCQCGEPGISRVRQDGRLLADAAALSVSSSNDF